MKTIKAIKVSEATGPALNWLVAKCLANQLGKSYVTTKYGWLVINSPTIPPDPLKAWLPSTDWAQGGPIIEREKIDCIADPNGKDVWMGQIYATRLGGQCVKRGYGSTPLIAAMRCYVASKLGDTTEVLEELL